jgi:hypothetical protein
MGETPAEDGRPVAQSHPHGRLGRHRESESWDRQQASVADPRRAHGGNAPAFVCLECPPSTLQKESKGSCKTCVWAQEVDAAMDRIRNSLIVYLALTFALSTIFYVWSFSGAPLGQVARLLMWMPAAAAIITQIVFYRTLTSLGWRLGRGVILGWPSSYQSSTVS